MLEKQRTMNDTPNKNPLVDADGEVRELTANDLSQFKPASEVLPATLQEKLGVRGRGLQKGPTKKRISIRLSPEVVQSFKSDGPGWQTRIDDALKEWLRTQKT